MRLALFLLLVGAAAASAQDGARLTTFVDCPGYVPGCDIDFFQTEIGFARFVRDQANADVYVLIVDQDTGGGGDRYTLYFQGRRGALAGRRDTLVTSAPPAASDDDQRRALLGRLALGLAGYASRTALADRISVSYAAPAAADTAAAEPSDPWNSWVFRLSGNGFFQGQSQFRSQNLFGSFSAQRVTEDLKVSVRPRISYNRSAFDITDDFDGDGALEDTTIVSDNASYGINGGVVVSLTDHWSAGAQGNVSRETFSNYDLRTRLGAAVEYNVFPYSESTRRQIRFFYSNGVETAVYQDTTIFLKTEEVLWAHEAGVAAEFAQPWGSVDIFTQASQFLSRPDKYSVGIGGGVDLRLFQGLSLRVDGNYRFVRDQINLRAQDPSSSEVLTQDQELATGFNYFGSVGISYSFGSIYNQVVNARFGD